MDGIRADRTRKNRREMAKGASFPTDPPKIDLEELRSITAASRGEALRSALLQQ